jgi:oligoribonuclease NrnB/cAMP/cGMP phosphodiesterase (DHH superfamily)
MARRHELWRERDVRGMGSGTRQHTRRVIRGIMKPLCIYHGFCADGFTAAWVVWNFHGEGAVEFHAAKHGDPPPEVGEREVYLVDFSYPRPVIEAMARRATKLTVIDHHVTAAHELEGLIRNDGVIDGVFDMDKSGCLLTWEWFFRERPPPPALLAVNDRDLWRFELPWTREIFSALTSYPYDFAIWNTLMEADRLDALRQEGVTLERKQRKDIAEIIAAGSHLITIAGHTVPACNVPSPWASDAGHLLAHGHPFAACFWIDGEQIAFSLRSAPDGLDVSEIATQFGGGGHRHAAGFKRPWTAYRRIAP